MADWSQYQENVAEFFRGLGLAAETNKRLTGVRTNHDIDVVVTGEVVGIAFTWIVECKHWSTRVPKEKVLALRTILDDTGVDRAFLMAEKGHQSGAIEAASNASVTLASLKGLRADLADAIGMVSLRSIIPRLEACRRRYWAIDKVDRIEHSLREGIGTGWGYSGKREISRVEHALMDAFFHGFPVYYGGPPELDEFRAIGLLVEDELYPADAAIDLPSELYAALDSTLSELENRLSLAERSVE